MHHAKSETLNISETVGQLTIGTAFVPMRGVYLTLCIADRAPIDMVIADNYDDAMSNHDRFLVHAQIVKSSFEELAMLQNTALLN